MVGSGARHVGPLTDLKVLDLAGPIGVYCTKLLADLGADVVRIKPPTGDPMRDIGPFYGDEPHPEKGLYWWHFNTSKRGVTLDIGNPDGAELLQRLVQSADVLLETFPPGHLEALGLGYEALAGSNQGLVMASITPFGQTGPYRDFKTSDLVSSAMGGTLFSCVQSGSPNALQRPRHSSSV